MFNILEQEQNLNTHIDTLATWWDAAEQGVARKGDTVIEHTDDDETCYTTFKVYGDDVDARSYRRILHRAEPPKPAWHDAPAIIATYRDDGGVVAGVWVPEGKPGYWEGPEGDVVASERLEDVTGLYPRLA